MNRVAQRVQEVRDMADLLVPPMRHVAKRLGYALGVHGSLSTDIDVIACPWVDRPQSSAEELKEHFVELLDAICGFAYTADQPTKKPQGRLAWSIVCGHDLYVDLSVMPIVAEPPAVAGDESWAQVLEGV